jgi:predicted dehydrogenase
MSAFLEQLASKAVDIRDLNTHEFPIESAQEAYNLIEQKPAPNYFGILLKYQPRAELPTSVPIGLCGPAGPVSHAESDGSAVGVGVIGVGRFATGTLLPELARAKGVRYVNITSASGISALTFGQKYGFARASSNPEEVITDPEVRAVLILTRNASHTPLTIQALRHQKAVFVEKPLSTSLDQLRECVQAWREAPGQVMLGFNRRHAKFTLRLKEFLDARTGPAMALYRINPGPLARGDWVRMPEEGGGRIIAEACHFVDYLQVVLGAAPTRVHARGLPAVRREGAVMEDVTVHLDFRDGSLGTLLYTAQGDPSFSKERVEFYAGGRVAVIDDFRELTLVKGGHHQRVHRKFSQDKGHRREIEVFIEAVRSREGLREEFPSYALATLAAFRILDSLHSDAPVLVKPEDIALEP